MIEVNPVFSGYLTGKNNHFMYIQGLFVCFPAEFLL